MGSWAAGPLRAPRSTIHPRPLGRGFRRFAVPLCILNFKFCVHSHPERPRRPRRPLPGWKISRLAGHGFKWGWKARRAFPLRKGRGNLCRCALYIGGQRRSLRSLFARVSLRSGVGGRSKVTPFELCSKGAVCPVSGEGVLFELCSKRLFALPRQRRIFRALLEKCCLPARPVSGEGAPFGRCSPPLCEGAPFGRCSLAFMAILADFSTRKPSCERFRYQKIRVFQRRDRKTPGRKNRTSQILQKRGRPSKENRSQLGFLVYNSVDFAMRGLSWRA